MMTKKLLMMINGDTEDENGEDLGETLSSFSVLTSGCWFWTTTLLWMVMMMVLIMIMMIMLTMMITNIHGCWFRTIILL